MCLGAKGLRAGHQIKSKTAPSDHCFGTNRISLGSEPCSCTPGGLYLSNVVSGRYHDQMKLQAA